VNLKSSNAFDAAIRCSAALGAYLSPHSNTDHCFNKDHYQAFAAAMKSFKDTTNARDRSIDVTGGSHSNRGGRGGIMTVISEPTPKGTHSHSFLVATRFY
jgi:hypothetical protein